MLRKPLVRGRVNGWQRRKKKCWSVGCWERKKGGGGRDWVREERKIHHLSDSGAPAALSWQRHPDCGQRLSQRGEVSQSTPSCNESDLAILLGQVRPKLKLESQAGTTLLASSIAHPSEHKLQNLPPHTEKYRLAHALYLHTHFIRKVTVLKMLEDGWMYCIVFLSRRYTSLWPK